ncbi:exported hypothetical protein [Magnetospirillum molischianum DSM 120]|uniref:Uncharacterized protein n=1 Tax=Magnetospirillum molischianum DSM 120 TaxID=1150626 RepID=H8FP29_MAGML|nr:exported hypothetical protein [Magnetospirillum molischianum DSM 120]
MVRVLIAAVILAVSSGSASAQLYNPLETTSDSRARHSAENYDTYRSRGNDAPLGGYSHPMGDPSPSGTLTPGYGSSGSGYGSSPLQSGNSQGGYGSNNRGSRGW